MRRKVLYLLLCSSLILPVFLQGANQSKNASTNLDYFYIVSTVVSDVAPFEIRCILDVRPTEGGLTIRNIQIAPPDLPCSSVTIKAVETKLKAVTPAELVGQINPCSLSLLEVLQSMKRPKTPIFGKFDSFGIVASCGGEERVYYLPSRGDIDFEGLQKEAPRVAALWDLSRFVQKAAFGEGSRFNRLPQDRDTELQRFGASLVPDLLAGKYDMGFAQFCGHIELHKMPGCDPNPTRTLLRDYRPGLKPTEFAGKLENAEQFHFIKYVVPVYPELAKRAHVESRINMELIIDPETGKTTKAIVLSGHPLLNESAINAALQWQFDLSLQTPKNSLKLVLIYSLACPQLSSSKD
jgi:hypothetical protein